MMKDMKTLLEELGFQSTEEIVKEEKVTGKWNKKVQQMEKQKERDKKNGAMDRDTVFAIAYAANKDKAYRIIGTVDAVSPDKQDKNVKVVSLNTIHIYIDNKKYIINHAHVRSDRVKKVSGYTKATINKKVELYVKIRPYSWNNNKYEVVDIDYIG